MAKRGKALVVAYNGRDSDSDFAAQLRGSVPSVAVALALTLALTEPFVVGNTTGARPQVRWSQDTVWVQLLQTTLAFLQRHAG